MTKFFIVAILILNWSFSANAAFEVKVAIVDVQSILESSIAISDIRKSINSLSEAIGKDMTIKEAELKKSEEELLKRRSSLDEEAFEKEANLFNKKVSAAQKDIQTRKTRLEQAHGEAVGKVHETTIAIITELAKKYNFNLVLPSSQVLFAKDELNITPEVIALLNKKLKEIKVNYK